MSVIAQSGIEVAKACLNTSTSKQMYTFSKASRFPTLKRSSSTGFYNIPTTLSKRATSFGFGNKLDLIKKDKYNKATFHDNSSDFNRKSPHGPQYSFSNGREKYGKVYLDSVKMFDKEIPGPGKLYIMKPFGSESPKYTMRSRNDNPVTRKEKVIPNPAPNLYNNVYKMNVYGKYPISSVRNVNSIRMNFDKTKRSDYIINKNPGPGSYNKKTLLSRIIESKYTSYEPRSILERHIDKDSRTNYPGPGSYKIHSDFGQYLSKDAEKYPVENVYVEKKPKFEERPWRKGMKETKQIEE